LSLKAKFAELAVNEKISGANALAEFFCKDLGRQSNIPYKKAVDTKSNLSSSTLVDILNALGLDASQFATKLIFIDSNLVNPRNYVAHGEDVDLSIEEYLELHDTVLGLIELYRNEVENASVTRRFERVTA